MLNYSWKMCCFSHRPLCRGKMTDRSGEFLFQARKTRRFILAKWKWPNASRSLGTRDGEGVRNMSLYSATILFSFAVIVILRCVHLASGKCPKVSIIHGTDFSLILIHENFPRLTPSTDQPVKLPSRRQCLIVLCCLFFWSKHQALLHNFKPVYTLDKGETIEVRIAPTEMVVRL